MTDLLQVLNILLGKNNISLDLFKTEKPINNRVQSLICKHNKKEIKENILIYEFFIFSSSLSFLLQGAKRHNAIFLLIQHAFCVG